MHCLRHYALNRLQFLICDILFISIVLYNLNSLIFRVTSDIFEL